MKKIILALAILLFASPAYAVVARMYKLTKDCAQLDGSAVPSGITLPWGIEHVGGPYFIVIDVGGAPIAARITTIRYTSGPVVVDSYTIGGSLDTNKGITFDGYRPIAANLASAGASTDFRKWDWLGDQIFSYRIATSRSGLDTNGFFSDMGIKGTGGFTRILYRRGALFEVRNFTHGITQIHDVAFDGRVWYVVNGTSTIYKLDLNGNTIGSCTATNGAFNGIATDGYRLYTVDALT